MRAPPRGLVVGQVCPLSCSPMGEMQGAVLERALETDEMVAAEAPRRRRIGRRGAIAIAVVGALVVAGGVTGGIAWAQQLAHDEAVEVATEARGRVADAVAAQHAALDALVAAGEGAIAARDRVAADVLAHEALLGGADAIAPVTAAHATLSELLAELYGVEAPAAGAELPGLRPLVPPAPVDPALETDALHALAVVLAAEAADAREARDELARATDELTAASAELEEAVSGLAEGLPGVFEALVAARTLASADSKAAGSAALEAIAAAEDPTELPALLASYATAAAGVIAAHDAEAARIAAEQAAAAAAAASRRSGTARSGGGGGGGGAPSNAVLSATNAQRAANGVAALAWSGTLASYSCSWASRLAASDSGLSHSGFPGGFRTWGENVAYGYGSASGVVKGWMDSPGHRANILNAAFTSMGACSATAASGTIYWVQQFGG